jgi:hypothetical protein
MNTEDAMRQAATAAVLYESGGQRAGRFGRNPSLPGTCPSGGPRPRGCIAGSGPPAPAPARCSGAEHHAFNQGLLGVFLSVSGAT